MQINFNSTIQYQRLLPLLNGVDSGPGPGHLVLRTDPKPTPGDTPDPQSLIIAIVQFTRPCGVIQGNTLQFIHDVQYAITALNNGTITWGRFVNSEGEFQVDMDAGLVTQNTAIKLDSTEQSVGNTIVPISMIIQEP